MNFARSAPSASAASPAGFRGSAFVRNLLGLGIGVGAGLAVKLTASPEAPWVDYLANGVARPIGDLFVRLLLILAFPLLLSAIVSGIGAMRDEAALRRLAGRTFVYFITASMLAALIGLAAVNLFRPGDGFDPATAQSLLAATRQTSSIVSQAAKTTIGLNGLVGVISANVVASVAGAHILGMILLAVLFGIGLARARARGAEYLRAATEGLFSVSSRLIGFVILVTPVATLCLMFHLVIACDWILLRHLGAYIGVVIAALLLYACVILSSAVWMLGGMNPLTFFRAAGATALMAFCTGSSQATLPTALKAAEEGLHVPTATARFMLAFGTSTNQNGTAIYQSVTLVFLAQVLGVQLDPVQQIAVFAGCVLGGIGTAGIPAGSLPVVAMMLAMLGIEPGAIGIVVGVDRLLDMCRTVLNVLGDLAMGVVISRRP